MNSVKMRVHGANLSTISMNVEAAGKTVSALVPCLEVEMVTTEDRHGNLTLRFIGDEVEAAKALFVPDAEVAVTFAPAG